MSRNWLRRGLAPLARFREGELATGLLMFAYSFLAMTAYNVVKPITRSKFISSLGADNLPYVQLAAGLLIGVLAQGYSVAVARLPRRYVAPLTLAGMSALLVGFWFLFQTAGDWVSVAFYLVASSSASCSSASSGPSPTTSTTRDRPSASSGSSAAGRAWAE